MKNILLWLREYGILLLVFLLLINTMQNCRQNSQLNRNAQAIKSNAMRIDSLSRDTYIVSKDELALVMEINRLQTAKLVLYDWNTVVRTVVRPDDRMNDYDVQIDKLTKELEKIRNNKGVINK